MIYNFLRTAIERHLDETKLLINQLTNQIAPHLFCFLLVDLTKWKESLHPVLPL